MFLITNWTCACMKYTAWGHYFPFMCSSLKGLYFFFGCFIGTSDSANKKLNTSYFPSTLSMFTILHNWFLIYPDASARTLELVLEFSRETFFSLFITHVISTVSKPKNTYLLNLCLFPLFFVASLLPVLINSWILSASGFQSASCSISTSLVSGLPACPSRLFFYPSSLRTVSLWPLCLCVCCPIFLKWFAPIQFILQNSVVIFPVIHLPVQPLPRLCSTSATPSMNLSYIAISLSESLQVWELTEVKGFDIHVSSALDSA